MIETLLWVSILFTFVWGVALLGKTMLGQLQNRHEHFQQSWVKLGTYE